MERPSRRRVVVGLGPDGRSTVLESGDPPTTFRFGGERGNLDPHENAGLAPSGAAGAAGPGEVVVSELWATGADVADGEDPTLGGGFGIELPPGGTRWRLVEMGPHRTAPMHRTVTTDYDLILEGEIDLVLERGPVRLAAGDAVVLPGVVHGWQTGERACRMIVTMVARAAG